MKVKNTHNMMRLFDIVVNDCCCSWNFFLYNVENEGWTSDMLQREVERCNNKGDFIRLANKFI